MQYYYNNIPVQFLGDRIEGDTKLAMIKFPNELNVCGVPFSELTTGPTDEYIISDRDFYNKGHCPFFSPDGVVISYGNLSALSKQVVREQRLRHQMNVKEVEIPQLTEDTRAWPEDNKDKETLNVIGRLLYGHDADSCAHNFNHESLIKKVRELVLLMSSMNKESSNTQLTESCPCLPGEKDCEICDPDWMPSGSINMVNNPPHYNNHPSGIECIEITRHMSFNLGNVFKYLWRCGDKGKYLEDLKKAAWYLNDEIKTTQEAQGK